MKKLIYSFSLVLLLSFNVFAKWVSKSDLKYHSNKQNVKVNVRKDGKFSVVNSVEYEITKLDGRDHFSPYKVKYDKTISNFRLIDAYVMNGKKITKVPKKYISDKLVSSEMDKVFDNMSEVSIHFPRLKVGSKVFLIYKLKYKIAQIHKKFFLTSFLGLDEYDKNSDIQIKSEIPLFLEVNDPFKVLKVSKRKVKNKYIIDIDQTSPLFKKAIDEQGYLGKDKLTVVSISSEKDWSEINNEFSSNFEKIINTPIKNAEIEKAIKKASGLKSLEEKVDYLSKYIIENFNYLGDFRLVRGRYTPQNISDFIKLGSGDCKDFSSLMVRMLRKVGINSYIALVERSSYPNSMLYKGSLPDQSKFNHSIVYIEDGKNNYWIDPTNKVTYGLKIRNDIANKEALILKKGVKSLTRIPDFKIEDNKYIHTKEYKFTNNNEATVKSNLYITGENALAFSGLEQALPKDKLDQAFKSMHAETEKLVHSNLSSMDLKDSKYKELNSKMEYEAESLGKNTNGVNVFTLSSRFFSLVYLDDFENKVMNHFFGLKQHINLKYKYYNIFAMGDFPQDCNIDTKWAKVTRKFDLNKEGIFVEDNIMIKNSFVDSSEYKGNDFAMFIDDVVRCARNSQFAYSVDLKEHKVTRSNVAELFRKLPSKERIEKRIELVEKIRDSRGKKSELEYTLQDAVKLLKLNLDEDPKHEESYVLLSNVILSLGYIRGTKYTSSSINQAKQIIDMAVALYPDSIQVNIVNAIIFHHLKKSEKAKELIARLEKRTDEMTYKNHNKLSHLYELTNDYKNSKRHLLLSIEKSNGKDLESAYFDLGGIAYSEGDINGCIENYKKSLDIDPKNAWAWYNMGLCYQKIRDHDNAILKFKEAINLVEFGAVKHALYESLNASANNNLLAEKYEEALKNIEEAIAIRPNKDSYILLARAYLGTKQKSKIMSAIKDGMKYLTNYNKFQYFQQVATVFSTEMNVVKFAIQKIIENTDDSFTKAEAFVSLAKSYIENRKEKKANSTLDKALGFAKKAKGNNKMKSHIELLKYDIFALKLKIENNLDNIDEAEKHILLARKLDPENFIVDFKIKELDYLNSVLGRKPNNIMWKMKKFFYQAMSDYVDSDYFENMNLFNDPNVRKLKDGSIVRETSYVVKEGEEDKMAEKFFKIKQKRGPAQVKEKSIKN